LATPGGDYARGQLAKFAPGVGSARAVFGLAEPLGGEFGVIGIILEEQMAEGVSNDLAVVLIEPGLDLPFHEFLEFLAERYIG
jgi:hypothetical protein